MAMIQLITPYHQRKRFLRPRRPRNIWRTVRRYQVLELVTLTGAIALVWLGAHLDNRRSPWAAQEPAGVESASVELTILPPHGANPVFRRPL